MTNGSFVYLKKSSKFKSPSPVALSTTVKTNKTLISTITILLLALPLCTAAQEENIAIYQSGKKYIDLNIKSLTRYNERVAKLQSKLLKKLKKQEKRYARKLQHKDTAAYANYSTQQLSYDSISKIKPGATTSKIIQKPIAAIDTLKAVRKFIADKIHLQGGANSQKGYEGQLADLQSQTNYNNYIGDLIGQRTNSLKSLNNTTKGNVKGFKGIDKQTYYARQKIKAFQHINDEPDKAEEAALEILQGQEGFEQYLQGNSTMPDLSGKSSSDLEKMGYQTKRQVQEQLQKKFGTNLSGLQQSMSTQIIDYKEQFKEVESTAKSAKQTKHAAKQLRYINKPTFRVNPMRGLPLRKRIEQQYNWQTTRATIDGKPAMFQFAAMAGYKHTPKLTYGIGVATAIGLGQNWNNIRFSFEGLGLRSFAEWKWQYGIGAYAGYERMYKQAAFLSDKAITSTETNKPHNTKLYNESVLVGLTKTYHINDRWNGSIQVLYDIWWKEKGLRSPVLLRVSTIKH